MSQEILVQAVVDAEEDLSLSEPEGVTNDAYDRLRSALEYAGFTLVRVDPA